MLALLGFQQPENVAPDTERPGLLRAPTRASDAEDSDVDAHWCELSDLSGPGSSEPGLEASGFESVDLSEQPILQQALAAIASADHISAESEAMVRDSLNGAELNLGCGLRLRVTYVADDGLAHRRAGPNGLNVNPAGIDGANGHDGAKAVHGDQDVFGTPLRQLMDGRAPELFRHRSPDGRNDDAGMFLLNLWVPLHQPIRPLVLMDRRTLDASRHQLRYGLPVTGFLDRSDDMAINDIWTFLHDDSQQWFYRSEMGPERGWLFDTLGTPHGAAVLPGEDVLEVLYVRLQAALGADAETPPDPPLDTTVSLPPTPLKTTPAIRALIQELSDCLDQQPEPKNKAAFQDWTDRAKQALSQSIRRSLELRLVASLIDD